MPPTSPHPPTSVADVLSGLLADPGRPRLTWYGAGGERVELSGAVLGNWVAKTVNLLVEELDAGPGTRVLLDLPPHWRAVVWAFAAWRVGATVLAGGPGDVAGPAGDGATATATAVADAGVVVSDRPGTLALPRGTGVVAVALPALARRFDGDLPPGALDAAQSVMTYGDVIGWAPATAPGVPALPGIPHARLVSTGVTAAPVAAGSRTLLRVDDDRAATSATLLAVLGVLAAGGSVVALHPEPGDAPDRADRLAVAERVTARVTPGA